MIHALQEFAGLPWAMMPVRLAALAEGLVRLVVDQRGLGGEAFTTRSVVVPDAPGLEVRGGREAGGTPAPPLGGRPVHERRAGTPAPPLWGLLLLVLVGLRGMGSRSGRVGSL